MVFSNQGPSSGVDDASKDEDVSVSIEAVAFISRFGRCQLLDQHCFVLCPVTS